MNWQVFTHLSTLQVQIHWVMALLSMLFGLIVLLRKKGTRSHKLFGRLFVFCMVVTSLSAFFVRSVESTDQWSLFSGFSLIHLLIPFTLFFLYQAIKAIREGRVKDHRNGMIVTFVGAIGIAGAFTFLPGRHMHTLFFGDANEVQHRVKEGLKH